MKKMNDVYEMPIQNEHCIIKTTTISKSKHNVYFLSDISWPYQYVELLELLSNASQEDEIHLHLNNSGGYCHTAFQIAFAINNSAALVFAHADVDIHSATSMIALACDSWALSPFTNFMCHAPSGGEMGKHHEVNAAVDFNKKYFKESLEIFYLPFLTKQEFNSMMDGKDFYFNMKDTMKRLEKVTKHREKEAAANE